MRKIMMKAVDAKTKDWFGKVLQQNGIGKCWKAPR